MIRTLSLQTKIFKKKNNKGGVYPFYSHKTSWKNSDGKISQGTLLKLSQSCTQYWIRIQGQYLWGPAQPLWSADLKTGWLCPQAAPDCCPIHSHISLQVVQQ